MPLFRSPTHPKTTTVSRGGDPCLTYSPNSFTGVAPQFHFVVHGLNAEIPENLTLCQRKPQICCTQVGQGKAPISQQTIRNIVTKLILAKLGWAGVGGMGLNWLGCAGLGRAGIGLAGLDCAPPSAPPPPTLPQPSIAQPSPAHPKPPSPAQRRSFVLIRQ